MRHLRALSHPPSALLGALSRERADLLQCSCVPSYSLALSRMPRPSLRRAARRSGSRRSSRLCSPPVRFPPPLSHAAIQQRSPRSQPKRSKRNWRADVKSTNGLMSCRCARHPLARAHGPFLSPSPHDTTVHAFTAHPQLSPLLPAQCSRLCPRRQSKL